MHRFRAVLAAVLLFSSGFGVCAEPPAPNHIRFKGMVDDDSVKATMTAMKAATKAGAKYLLIEINSPGGLVDPGFALAKAIEESPVPVVCVVDGDAMSMAFAILQSCPTRIATSRSVLMLHKPVVGGMMGGTDHFFQNLADYLRVISEALLQQCARRMNIPADDIRARIDHQDWYLTPREALEVGALDGVVSTVAAVKAQYE